MYSRLALPEIGRIDFESEEQEIDLSTRYFHAVHVAWSAICLRP
jgi:hypothetical protein